MTRSRALTAIAIPLAIALTVFDDAQARQPVTAQPSAVSSRSGIDLGAMDKSASACTDFYQYACGGWIAKHPTPPDQPRYGRFDELQDRNNEILDSYVRNHKLAQTPVPTVDVATAYAYADAATQAQVVTTLGLDQPETAAQARGRTAGMPPVT